MAGRACIVTDETVFTWGGTLQRLPRGQVIDVPPGSRSNGHWAPASRHPGWHPSRPGSASTCPQPPLRPAKPAAPAPAKPEPQAKPAAQTRKPPAAAEPAAPAAAATPGSKVP